MFNMKALPPIERKLNGSLPFMTPKQHKEAVRLIRKTCCNYNDGDCLFLDDGCGCVCVQSVSYSVVCKYFRRVLLESKEGLSLKAELFRDDAMKRCAVCENKFKANSNRAKYCGDCSPNVRRKKQTANARERRSKIKMERVQYGKWK